MPATITGVVFHDLNHNGVLNAGEPGIPNVFLTLFNTATNTCVQTSTNVNGVYSFSVSTEGTYRVYETVSAAASCPPTLFSQPAGFTLSNGPRVRTVTVTATQVTSNATLESQNFSHDTINAPLACTTAMIQLVNTPTEWFDIDVVTGMATFQGLLDPPDNVNAIGYNILDHYIYGYDQTTNHIVRIDRNRVLMQLVPNPTGLPANNYNVGSFDLNGHLFLMVNNTARYYTVDLRPNSPTFMKLVDPTNGYVQQTSNFGTALSATLNVSDWAFNPADGFLYGVRPAGNTAQVMRVNPTTGAVTGLTTALPPLNPVDRSWGAVAFDASGALFAIYNGDGGIFRFTISGDMAVGDRISTTFTTNFNDAVMCPEALVGPISDIAVHKTALPNPVMSGEPLTYTIKVSNLGPDVADGVMLTDLVPPELLAPEYSLDDGATFSPWPDILSLGAFAGGESRTVLIRGIADSSVVGAIPNTATVDSKSSDPDPGNNISTVDVEIIASADMSVTKTAAPSPVTAGNPITFTVDVSNLGPSDAQNVTLTDPVPAQITDAMYSTDGGATFLPWTGPLDLGTFAAGKSETVLIRGIVNPDASGNIDNTVEVSSITPDPNPDNNTSTAVVPVNGSADMAVNKTASPDPATPGDLITFRLLVSNQGPSNAQDVILTDAIPPTVLSPEYSLNDGVSFLPWTGTLDLETVAVGISKTILIRGTVRSDTAGTITNTATVSSTTPDPDSDNNTSTVTVAVAAAADMAVDKTVSPDQAVPGESLTYTVVVSNLGPSTAENVTLTDAVPSQLVNPEYSVNGAAFLPWTGSLTLGAFTAGASETVLLRGTVSSSASGLIVNTATVSSTTPDPNPDNNTSTAAAEIRNARDQAITDLIESIALEEAALAHILNAEGEKLQKFTAMTEIAPDTLLQVNQSVQSMVDAVSLLENVLLEKLGLFDDCLCEEPPVILE